MKKIFRHTKRNKPPTRKKNAPGDTESVFSKRFFPNFVESAFHLPDIAHRATIGAGRHGGISAQR